MSRRDYAPTDRYDDRPSDYYRRPRTERDFEETDIDITRSRSHGPSRRGETVVREREREDDTVVTQGRRSERPRRNLDFLQEDYGRNSRAGPLVVREDREEVDEDVRSRGGRTVREERREVDDETYVRSSRAPPQRARSRGPAREEREEIIYRERDSSRPARPPYPASEAEFSEMNEVKFTDRTRERSRPPPSRVGGRADETIDIRIRERDRGGPPPPRSDYQERDAGEVRFKRGVERGGGRSTVVEEDKTVFREKEESRAPPQRNEVDKEEIIIREKRSSTPPRERRAREVSKEEIDIDIRERNGRGRDVVKEDVDIDVRERSGRGRDNVKEEIDIDIRERSRQPPPRHRSQSRGALVAKKEEEWIIRRPRTPSPSPSPPPPPRDYEKEEIIIRKKTRTPSPEPEPPREPTPEPPPPPPLEPIYRPPIIQEVITHHRHIDHPIERVRSPTPPPPSPPSPAKEENLEIEIKRSGTRNGKPFDEDIIFEQDISERKSNHNRERSVARSETVREVDRKETETTREVSRQRSVSRRRTYDDDIGAEADYYNRRVASRAYPGEAWNGATKDWGLLDVPPGTERVRMDGQGGGRQEVFWDRYAGERRGKFVTGDRVYEEGFGALPAAPAPPPAPAPPSERSREHDVVRETKITERRITEETSRGKTRDRMWTEIAKDLVTKEAIEEMAYEFEEADDVYYVMEYLRYEDVLKLVELTEDIRRERRERIREIQWGRSLPPPMPPVPPPPSRRYDDRYYERDIRYERDTRRRR